MAAKTGRNCALTVGSTTIALLTEWTIEAEMDSAEAGDLDDEWVDTEPGLKRWRLTGRTNFDGAHAPLLSQLNNQASTTVSIYITNAAGTTFFKGNGWQIRGTVHGPQGMGDGEIVVVGNGQPSTIL